MKEAGPTETSHTLLDEMERKLFRDSIRDQPAYPLFHYTDAAGTLGIVKSGELWATHFRCLNDRTELVAGEKIAQDEMTSVLERYESDTPERFVLEELARIHRKARLSEIANVFIASLSEDGDLLSQWRAYGHEGAGFSLGFSSFNLPKGDHPDPQASLSLSSANTMRSVSGQIYAQSLSRSPMGLKHSLRENQRRHWAENYAV